jgi:hypothetical protein
MKKIYDEVIKARYSKDILVVGAGSAGCLAALAAASHGQYTVAIAERYGFAGGTSTQMLDTFYGFFTPGDAPKKVVGGLPDSIVNALNKAGDIFLRPNTYGAGTGVNYNPERLKLVWEQLMQYANIQMFYHSMLVEVLPESESYACIFFNKGMGFFAIDARVVIDASGDADFCALAELPFEKAGELEPVQSMTTTFRMANVDLKKFEEAGGKGMLKNKMKEAVENGKHALPRKEGSAHEMCIPGCISTVAVKVAGADPLDVEGITAAEREGRRQAFVYEDFFRSEVPGYENAKIIGLSHQIGVRETRRVYGKYRLTKEDCIEAKMPDDRIFLCGAPIEDHRKGAAGESETYWNYVQGNGIYGVPYGTIVPNGAARAWVAGRCFSATHDAHASCRSMAQTMSMGKAAGFSAIIALQHDLPADEVPVALLQDMLLQAGAVLEVPQKTADTSRSGWSNNLQK